MKKEEKSKRTYDKILQAAILEFGNKSYDVASLNNICQENQISKGLIYHNFKNKDALYIACVKTCYDAMIEYLKVDENTSKSKTIQMEIHALLQSRQSFFETYPCYKQLFLNSILLPPKHLLSVLKPLQTAYYTYIQERYKAVLSQEQLRHGVSIDNALRYLITFQEMYNGYFQTIYDEDIGIDAVVELHETRLTKCMDMVLYGIAKYPENKKE